MRGMPEQLPAAERWNRREVLRLGALAGVSVATSGAGGRLVPSEQPAHRAFGRARSCLLVFLAGGPSHLDTFDPKPDAPIGVRGEFRSIRTAVPGVWICEHLPRLARRAHRFTIVRSLQHADRTHGCASYRMLTGQPYPHDPSRAEHLAREDHPHIGAIAAATRSGLFVTVPALIGAPGLARAGQHAATLGPDHDPWVVAAAPGGAALSAAEPGPGPGRDRYARLERAAHPGPARDSERYGLNRFGSSVLLGRRMVEAGARFVQVNWPASIDGGWDTHADGFATLKDVLLPQADPALSALFDDLAGSGALDETLVVIAGEFGRSPRVSANGGRDHWPAAYSALVAGAGIAGGRVIGATDSIGSTVVDRPVTPTALAATMLFALGSVPPASPRGPRDESASARPDGPVVELWS